MSTGSIKSSLTIAGYFDRLFQKNILAIASGATELAHTEAKKNPGETPWGFSLS